MSGRRPAAQEYRPGDYRAGDYPPGDDRRGGTPRHGRPGGGLGDDPRASWAAQDRQGRWADPGPGSDSWPDGARVDEPWRDTSRPGGAGWADGARRDSAPADEPWHETFRPADRRTGDTWPGRDQPGHAGTRPYIPPQGDHAQGGHAQGGQPLAADWRSEFGPGDPPPPAPRHGRAADPWPGEYGRSAPRAGGPPSGEYPTGGFRSEFGPGAHRTGEFPAARTSGPASGEYPTASLRRPSGPGTHRTGEFPTASFRTEFGTGEFPAGSRQFPGGPAAGGLPGGPEVWDDGKGDDPVRPVRGGRGLVGMLAAAVVVAGLGAYAVARHDAPVTLQTSAGAPGESSAGTAGSTAGATGPSSATGPAVGAPSPSPSRSRTGASPRPARSTTPAATSPSAAPPPPAPSASAAAGTASAQAAAEVLAVMNQARSQAGLPPYTMSAGLDTSAERHTMLMASGCGLQHQCPGEPALGTRISAAGVQWTAAGENIGDGGPVPGTGAAISQMAVSLTQSMLAEQPPDDGHRLNILSSTYQFVGIYVFRDSSGTVWMTQDFSN